MAKKRSRARGARCRSRIRTDESGRSASVEIPVAVGKRLGGGTRIPVRVTIEGMPFHAVLRAVEERDEFEYFVWHLVHYSMHIYVEMHRRLPLRKGMWLDLHFVREEHPKCRRGKPVPKELY